MEAFKKLFRFVPEYAGFVGVERECFIVKAGTIVPLAGTIVPAFGDPARFGYELSACQLEERTLPGRIGDLRGALEENGKIIAEQESALGFSRLFSEVGPENMPLDVYPDPTGRYQRITKGMPRSVLLAACRVIGTHVHIGMPDHDTALRVYNRVIRHSPELCEMGDGSFGERLAIYRQMAPHSEPRPYANWDECHRTACVQGFATDPRRCWTLIRISIHGTIEFRMFGATDSLNRVVGWAETCHRLCMEAMH